jgi:hypothetical protein
VSTRPLSARDLRRLFEALDAELRSVGIVGELYLVGGAVMCLVHAARASTRDVDGLFRPAAEVRDAARRVAARAGLEPNWLNDAVKGYLSPAGEFDPYLELGHLRVMVAPPAYLLAMKCLAFRIGEGFHDEADVRFLLRLLEIERYDAALAVIGRYYPIERLPQKTLYALEELLGGAA